VSPSLNIREHAICQRPEWEWRGERQRPNVYVETTTRINVAFIHSTFFSCRKTPGYGDSSSECGDEPPTYAKLPASFHGPHGGAHAAHLAAAAAAAAAAGYSQGAYGHSYLGRLRQQLGMPPRSSPAAEDGGAEPKTNGERELNSCSAGARAFGGEIYGVALSGRRQPYRRPLFSRKYGVRAVAAAAAAFPSFTARLSSSSSSSPPNRVLPSLPCLTTSRSASVSDTRRLRRCK